MADADPLNPAAFAALALTEGIKFVYAQATELLKRRRERKATGAAPAEPIPLEHGEVLDGLPAPLEPDYEVLDQLQERVTSLAVELSKYQDGLLEPDAATGQTVDELRKALEAIYGQRLTFKGEREHESTGTVISGELRAALVKGLAIAADVGNVRGGATVTGGIGVDTVDTDGTAIGVRAKDIGG
jgi:hypothetical protein